MYREERFMYGSALLMFLVTSVVWYYGGVSLWWFVTVPGVFVFWLAYHFCCALRGDDHDPEQNKEWRVQCGSVRKTIVRKFVLTTEGLACLMVTLLVVLMLSYAGRASAAEVEWFLQPLAHGSDPFDGGASDQTFDFYGGGFTLTAGERKRWEVDGVLGRKAHNCDARKDCKTTPGGMLGVRYYPGRGRRGR